eukprot:GHRR01033938.1.p1 GENE.GHRR01033938.1~~GHRR01033938.1.p1  ORF type:complete len:130 (-),score=19.08 GHRR01033938.1:35-424(-)
MCAPNACRGMQCSHEPNGGLMATALEIQCSQLQSIVPGSELPASYPNYLIDATDLQALLLLQLCHFELQHCCYCTSVQGPLLHYCVSPQSSTADTLKSSLLAKHGLPNVPQLPLLPCKSTERGLCGTGK